jgi:hypothetical protein
MGEIVDNSPEMALDDPRIAEFVAKASGEKPESLAEPKKDVKEKPAASSAADKADETDEKDETPEHLKAQIRGLQAELTRRKGNSDRVEALEQELQGVKEKLAKPETTSEFAWIQKLDDEGLSSKSVDWDDELADARAKYGRAEEAGDDRAMERQGQRILQAKKIQSAFRKETLDRTRRNQEEANALHTETQSIQTEIADMREAVSEQFPDLMDQETDLWKAGNDEFNSHPVLMSRLGPLGEVVAAAMAIVRNPDLVSKKAAPNARREVLSTLEKSVKKSLSTGATAPNIQRNVDYTGSVGTAEGLSAFNAMIDKFKGG